LILRYNEFTRDEFLAMKNIYNKYTKHKSIIETKNVIL